MHIFRAFWKDSCGATAIEYALIASIISLAVVVGATKIGTNLLTKDYTPVANALT